MMKKYFYFLAALCLAFSTVTLSSCSKDGESAVSPDTGKGGSLARFTISANYLYAVDNQTLHTFSLADPKNPQKVNATEIGFEVETIYTWEDKLFIGSRDAMYIYSIKNPSAPVKMGFASHVRACDPVVANDTAAYVTVRSGNNCGGDINALYVFQVDDIMQPVLMRAIQLQNPHGLGIHNNTLFVCDGNAGLKIYDITEPYNPLEIKTVTGEQFYDCIPDGNILICMIEGGMAIYDITNARSITLLAKITE